MREKLIMIGNGMAGMKTVEELISLAPNRYDITVFGAEPHGNYNRIMLSSVLAGEKELHEIMMHTPDWYDRRGIQLLMGHSVARIDRIGKKVVAENGAVLPYDKLVLATGSNPIIIPFPGHDLDGVVAFRSIQDVEAMIAVAKVSKKAVVIGGGLLGLEAADGLKKRGMEVTVVHLMDILMERQLDALSSEMLQSKLESRGIQFRMKTATKAILGEEGRVVGIRFEDGSDLETDLVVMAIGVRPDMTLAREAGLVCDRGVVVDGAMTSSDKEISAVGECIQHQNRVYGLVAPLYEQGRILARHLAGEENPGVYAGSVVSTRLKVSGIDLFSSGDIRGDEESDEMIYRDLSRSIYKKLTIRNEKIQGIVLLGDTVDSHWYLDLMKENKDISDVREGLLFGRSAESRDESVRQNVADMPMDREICGCNGVRKQAIVEAILIRELKTLEDVKVSTRAASSCGSCAHLVEAVLADTLGDAYVVAKTKPLCGCTTLTSHEVRHAIQERKLTSTAMAFAALEFSSSDGCPMCRQAINYYIHALWPEHHVEEPQSRFINERIHANIQKDGTYSVVPRIWGGVTTPDQLRTIADIAEKFSIREIKFTGGQRLTLLGIQKEKLPAVWAELAAHDMVSGHAYGKAIRTVKTCVGDQWCRFGTQNSEAMGIRLEKLIWNSWTPHKYKLAVSGCPRNCAEATIKDFGVVAVESGWELHVGGNGGMKVRATDFLVKVETEEEVEEYAVAFLQLYREEAGYLERTAPWIERVGMDSIRSRVVADDAGRQQLVSRFNKAHRFTQDPWKERAVNGVAAHEFKPLLTIKKIKEEAA